MSKSLDPSHNILASQTEVAQAKDWSFCSFRLLAMSRPLRALKSTSTAAVAARRTQLVHSASTSAVRLSVRLSHSAATAAASSSSSLHNDAVILSSQSKSSLRPLDSRTSATAAALESTPSSTTSVMPKAVPDARYARHLNSLFPTLNFPPELAKRILTHSSHHLAHTGHNGRLSFIGRRALQTYLLAFLHRAALTAPPSSVAEWDYDAIIESTVGRYALGEHVAPHLDFGAVLRWQPSAPVPHALRGPNYKRDKADTLRTPEPTDFSPVVLKSVGLYKVHGETVHAIVGGVYHQFGASAAQRLFHTHILPHVLLPGRARGLPDALHYDALEIAKKLEGRALINGSRVSPSSSSTSTSGNALDSASSNTSTGDMLASGAAALALDSAFSGSSEPANTAAAASAENVEPLNEEFQEEEAAFEEDVEDDL